MKQIYQARDEMEAHWVKGELEQHGIAATVLGTLLSRAVPEVPFTKAYPTVHVSDEHEAEACEVVAALLAQVKQASQAAPEQADPWICPVCDEVLEGQFSHCWNCGERRKDV